MKYLFIISSISLFFCTGCGNKAEITRLQDIVDANTQRQSDLTAQQVTLEAKVQQRTAALQTLETARRAQESALNEKKVTLNQLKQQKTELSAQLLGNDLITLANGKNIEGVIEKFEAGAWHIRMESGEIKKGSSKNIKSIQFASP